jgi:succinoglycan biosynthesis transport protein ExoP
MSSDQENHPNQNAWLPLARSAPTDLALSGARFEKFDRTSQPEPTRAQPGLADYARLLRKHRWTILAVSALTIAITGFYVFLKRPLYTATATLKVNFYTPVFSGAGAEDTFGQQSRSDQYINTLVEQISSPGVARRVLAHSDLSALLSKDESAGAAGPFSWLFSWPGKVLAALQSLLPSSPRTEGAKKQSAGEPSPSLNSINSYLGRLVVSPIVKTTLIDLSVTTGDRSLSAALANAHAQAFIDHIRSERQGANAHKVEFLEQQAQELNAKVERSEQALARYAEEHAIVAMDKDKTIVLQQFGDLNQLSTQLTAKRLASEGLLTETSSGVGLEAAAVDAKSLSDLRSSLREAEAEYAQLSQKFRPGYPKMKELKARIDSLRKQASDAIKARYESEREAEKKIQEQLETVKRKVFEMSRTQVQYNMMQSEYESLKDLRQTVLRQIEQARVGAENQETNVVLSQQAEVPLFRSSPRRTFIMIVAALFGPLLGFGMALALERINTTFKHLDEVQELLGLPILGSVPNFLKLDRERLPLGEDLAQVRGVQLLVEKAGTKDGGAASEPTAAAPTLRSVDEARSARATHPQVFTLLAPRSLTAEAFRTIRTNLLLSSADTPPRALMVVSSQKGEGKSTIIANLAVSLAQIGRKTVLIESDLRCPRLAGLFNFSALRAGLVDHLTGQVSLEDVVLPTSVANLYLLPAGSSPPDPADLVSSEKMAKLIPTLLAHFDYVLLDAPPVMPVADALSLSRLVDGVLFVVRAKQTEREAAVKALQQLRRVRAKIFGVVLNCSEDGFGSDSMYGDQYLPAVREPARAVGA